MPGTWASGWALNDIVTVGEFSKGVGCVADTTLGASAASIDLTSLPTTYAHLLIVLYVRGDTATTSTNMNMRFNNDTAANYYTQVITASSTSVTGSESIAATSAICGDTTANTATAGRFSSIEIIVPHYANASNKKSWRATSISPVGTLTNTIFYRALGGVWDAAAAAINRVTFFPAAGNLVTGSRVSVYVLGA